MLRSARRPSRSPSAISLRSSDRSSNGVSSSASSRRTPSVPGARFVADSPAHSSKPARPRPAASRCADRRRGAWTDRRSGRDRRRARSGGAVAPALARSTSGNATAWPAIGSKPAASPGSSAAWRRASDGCRPPARTGSGESRGAGPPAPVRVAPDLARLDLDDEEAAIGMGDHEVGLALAPTAVAVDRADPGDVLEDPVVGRQRGTKAIGDTALGGFPLGQRAPSARFDHRTSVDRFISTLSPRRDGSGTCAPIDEPSLTMGQSLVSRLGTTSGCECSSSIATSSRVRARLSSSSTASETSSTPRGGRRGPDSSVRAGSSSTTELTLSRKSRRSMGSADPQS